MLMRLLDWLFGCPHNNCTFPLRMRNRVNASTTTHSAYVVCLTCGKEFPYDWEKMRTIWTPGREWEAETAETYVERAA